MFFTQFKKVLTTDFECDKLVLLIRESDISQFHNPIMKQT